MVCSAHMQAGNPGVAAAQSAELRARTDARRNLGWKIYVQGDFNLDWKQSHFWCDYHGDEPYRWEPGRGGTFHEADWVDRRDTGPCGKYDYAETVNPAAHVDTAYMFNPTNSDHDWLQSYPWSPYENLNPIGNQELVRRVPGGVRVSGWAIDPDSTLPIDVHNYVGGDGENLGPSNLVRNDVRTHYPAFGRNHGFNGVNANYLPYGTYSVCSYGINVSGGTNTAVACSNLTYEVDAFGNLEYVNNAGGNTSFGWLINIAGWGLDPDTAGAIPIHVYTSEFFGGSGTLGTPGAAGFAYSAGLNRPDLAPLFPEYGTNHGFNDWVGAPGAHQYLCANAINAAGSGNWRIIGCNKFR